MVRIDDLSAGIDASSGVLREDVSALRRVVTSGKAGGLIMCEPLKAVDSGAT